MLNTVHQSSGLKTGCLLVFCCCLVSLALAQDQETGLPDLKEIFATMDQEAFSQVLSDKIRVNTDIRPLLQDYGNLTRHQVLLTFDKLSDRFSVLSCEITNSQSDTNYSWLEIYLHLELQEKNSGQIYRVTYALHFKIAASRIALNRWVLQDIR